MFNNLRSARFTPECYNSSLAEINTSNQFWSISQYDRPDFRQGYVLAFRRDQSPFPSAKVALRGLDDKADYLLTNVDTQEKKTVSGSAETFRECEKAHPDLKKVPVSGDFELWPEGVADAAVKVSLGGRGGSVEGALFRMDAPLLAKDNVTVDLGKCEVAKITPPTPTNGMDFWKLDALHVPDFPTCNIMPNPSFEQGLRYWFWTDGGAAEFKPDQSEMKYDVVPGGKFGKHALILRTIQPGTVPLKSFPLALKSGTTYTLSLYAKAPDAKAPDAKDPVNFSVGLSSVSNGGKFTSPKQNGNFWGDNFKPEAQFKVGKDWTRFSRTFVADGAGVHLQMGSAGTDIMIDGIQLEEGDKATDFVCSPVEGNFVFSRSGPPKARSLKASGKWIISSFRNATACRTGARFPRSPCSTATLARTSRLATKATWRRRSKSLGTRRTSICMLRPRTTNF